MNRERPGDVEINPAILNLYDFGNWINLLFRVRFKKYRRT